MPDELEPAVRNKVYTQAQLSSKSFILLESISEILRHIFDSYTGKSKTAKSYFYI